VLNNDLFFDLNEEEVKQTLEKYTLIEPLLDENISPANKRMYRKMVREKLQISDRSLRRMVKRFKEKGLGALVRKKRVDSGTYRKFDEALLNRALELLKENPYRSIPTLTALLQADPVCAPLIKQISPATLYFHLKKAGINFQKKYIDSDPKVYHQFEADYPNQLWQGDARHGIFLPDPKNPKKTKRTYLFAWIDDFSRKVTFARYYWDEKLPRMEDCFRQAVLRWGQPEKLYCDNGRVYLSNHFLFLAVNLGIRKIHHPAYCAWCKGKIEAMMKIIKKFQREAALAGFKTLEELNTAFWAWLEMEYHQKRHSATGETPNDRYKNNIHKHPPKRIKDLDEFNSLFLWREIRTVSKYGKIRLENNQYYLKGIAPGTKVEIRYNPFDLETVQVYHENKFFTKVKANVLFNKQLKIIPEEKQSKPAEVSKASADYFQKLREKHDLHKHQEHNQINYADLNKKED
jgi:putative transposase